MAPQETYGKRKRQEEDTSSSNSFQEYWTKDFYFIERNGKPFCLLCDTSLSENGFKKLNLKRHYEKVHVKENNWR